MYDIYSFFANSSTTVDLPTRLAPFIINARLPPARSFQSRNWLYIFLLKVSIYKIPIFIYCKISKIPISFIPKTRKIPIFNVY